MKLSLLTREYPPSIYGGAGVHVAQLVPQLRKFIEVDVHCMGEPRDGAVAGLAHAVDIDFDELPELWDELGHMDPSPAVDRWWVLTSQQRQFHTLQ